MLTDFTRITEETRTSTGVIDPTSGEQTEINEHGPRAPEAERQIFAESDRTSRRGEHLRPRRFHPARRPRDLYADLVAELSRPGSSRSSTPRAR